MRRITLRELIDRGRQALLARLEGSPHARRWVFPDNGGIFAENTQPLAALARLSGNQWTRFSPAEFGEGASLATYQAEQLVRSADLALEGCFDVLGIERLRFGCPIDWHLEPMSGRRSPLIAWKQLDSLDASLTGDKKVVWELNRHQHLLTLGRAFIVTGNDRYAAAVGEHIAAWIRANPPGRGINWVSSLELAFRCISWLWSLALIRTWGKWQTLPLADIAQFLYYQGCHIERFLSTYSSPNTHLTGEALGLYYLGTCVPDLKRAARWRELGRSILLQQLDTHVRADGVYFEQSTWYHRYTADFYMHFSILADRTGDQLPSRVREQIASLLDFLMWITRPDGSSPYLGDDDGGKLLRLDALAPSDWRAVLSNGAVMYGRGDYKHVAGEFMEETHWLFGPEARQVFRRLAATPPVRTSRAFLEGGVYVMRSGWSSDSNYLLIDCGPHGSMNCGHAHADALSIEVAALGSTIVVDPGTLTYTGSGALRDLFRHSAMHNTLTIDGISSSIPAGAFRWKHIANCTLHYWHDHPRFSFFQGSHDGYERLPDPATHTRSVFFVNREYWLMLDRADTCQEHELVVHFHLAPSATATVYRASSWLTARTSSASLEIVFPEEQGTWDVADCSVSPCYAARIPASHAKYVVTGKGPIALFSVLFPRIPGQELPKLHNLALEQGKGTVIAMPRSRDLAIWSGKAAPEVGIDAVDFEWVWARQSADAHHLEQAICLHGTHLSFREIEITADRDLAVIAVNLQHQTISIDVSPPAGMRIRAKTGVNRILVNGAPHTLGHTKVLDLKREEIPQPSAWDDSSRSCGNVRH